MTFDPVLADAGSASSPGGGTAHHGSSSGHALTAALVSVLAALLLSACGSAPQRSVGTAVAQPAPSISKPGPRGGGYYKDDGPDAVTPENLETIPDAEPRLEPLHRFANRPYNVFGQGYVPATELRPFRESGRASWYGRRFHGKPTSSGEPYDMYAMTAAHPTLPIPSYVRVTHLASGRSVVVRVNDRGPFHKSRIIDLSYTAAYKLGYINAGSADVDIEQIVPDELPLIASAKSVPALRGRSTAQSVRSSAISSAAVTPAPAPEAELTSEPKPEPMASRVLPPLVPPLEPASIPELALAPQAEASMADSGSAAEGLVPHIASASAGIYLQLGAFASLVNAEGFKASVEQEVIEHAERVELFADGERFRLHAGPYDTVDAARAAAVRLGTTLKLKPFVIVR